ncbi:MAG: M20/M25/M40 family metallo-hydrolase [Coprococcus comes]
MKKRSRCVEEVGNTFKKVAEKYGAESELTCEVHLIAYETAKDSVPVKRFERVSKELGLAGDLVETFGGSDNNSFAKNGIPGLVLSNGMYQAHSVNEYTTIKDLVTGAELIAGLITDEQ